jgi:hypothetical protein
MIRDLLARLRTIDEGNLMAWAGENWVRKSLGELYVRYCGELAPLICKGIERTNSSRLMLTIFRVAGEGSR